MVIVDQFRISDNGELMYIDSHVNKADCFENVYIKRMTICTEDQVSELSPETYGDEFIYQETFDPTVDKDIFVPINKKVKVLSEQQLLTYRTPLGGLGFEYTPLENAQSNALSLILSGKYTELDDVYAPLLVVASGNFNPQNPELDSSNVFFTVEGTKLEEQGHSVWQFKGKGNLEDNEVFNIYLFKKGENGTLELVDVEDTDDVNFLHFYYQLSSKVTATYKKQIHEVLCAASFNEAFDNLAYDQEGEPYKEDGEWARIHEGPVATKSFSKNDLSSNMFFVYFECEGAPSQETPCILDGTTLAVTFDYGIIFNGALGYAKEVTSDCNIPYDFIDFILNFNALKLSLETDHYIPAIDYWKRLSKESKKASGTNTKTCGCHG